jgi:hypothetical protein
MKKNKKRALFKRSIKGLWFSFLFLSLQLNSFSFLTAEASTDPGSPNPAIESPANGQNDVDTADIQKRLDEKADSLHIPFVENQGQVNNDRVRFSANLFSGPFFVTDDNLTYVINKKEEDKQEAEKKRGEGYSKIKASHESTNITSYSLKERFLDGAGNPIPVSPEGEDQSQSKVNYLLGNDSSKWKQNVETYDTLKLGEPWNNIKVGLKAYGKNVEKIFTVGSGGNPSDIQMQFDGADRLEISASGELVVKTSPGDISLSKPIAFQNINGERKDVAVRYTISENNGYGFEVGEYDPNEPLVIDPLLASTYIGGSDDEWSSAITIDPSGDVIMATITLSTDYPVVAGAAQYTFGGGNYDAAISKLDSDLTTLKASTFLGGSNTDWPFAVDTDLSGNVVVVGEVLARETGGVDPDDFPTTAGADQTVCGGGPSGYTCWDAFATKLSNDLSSIEASTYLGGNSNDEAYGIDIDSDGSIYVGGVTYSTDFGSLNGYQNVHIGSTYSGNAYIRKFNPSLVMLASTYIGRDYADYENDVFYSVKIDPISGSVFGYGFSESSTFPVTEGAFQPAFAGGSRDAVIAKFNNNLSQLQGATYLGGEDWDVLINETNDAMTIDGSGNVFVGGTTYSISFPVTEGAFNTHMPSGIGARNRQVYVSKLSNDLHNLLASTFLGGTWDEEGAHIGFLSDGRLMVAGDTNSVDFPVTDNAIDTVNNSEASNYVAIISSDLRTLYYGTYLDGIDSSTYSWYSAIDGLDNIYVNGETYASLWPTTEGAYRRYLMGYEDNYITKISVPPLSSYEPGADPQLDPYSVNHLEIRNNNPLGSEGFEGVTFPPTSWSTGGDANWSQDSTYKTEGTYSATSGTLAFSQTSWIDYSYNFPEDSIISFDWKIDSASDAIVFCVDHDDCARYSNYEAKTGGNIDWAQIEAPITGGQHNLRWKYLRNSYGDNGINKAWLDDVSIVANASILTTDTGDPNIITIKAIGDQGEIFSAYNGDKTLTFSGASMNGGTHPTINDKNGNPVNFGSPTTLTFVNGEVTTTTNLYKVESGSIDATDGTYGTSGDAAYDLDFTVNEGPPTDPVQSSISATPAPVTAGNQVSITVTANDINGDPQGYGGDTVVITVSGSNSASPSVTDNGDGTYTATYTPANSGIDQITATIGGSAIGSDTDGTSDGTFNLTVNANNPIPVPAATIDPARTSITAEPSPTTTGNEVTITITSYDTDGDPYTTGGQNVVITVSGSNSASPTVTDNGDGTYTATYTPDNVGEDLITGTINGDNIGSDTDGTSDGTFNLTISSGTCGGESSITLSSTKDNKLTFDICILEGESAESDEVSGSEDQDTDLRKVSLEASSSEVIEGDLEVKKVTNKPSDVVIPSEYADKNPVIYKYLRVNPSFSNKYLDKAKLYLRIPKSWITDNDIEEIVFLRSDNSDNEVLKYEKTSESDTAVTYRVHSDKLPKYWTMFGIPKETIVTPNGNTDEPGSPDTPTSPTSPDEPGSPDNPNNPTSPDIPGNTNPETPSSTIDPSIPSNGNTKDGNDKGSPADQSEKGNQSDGINQSVYEESKKSIPAVISEKVAQLRNAIDQHPIATNTTTAASLALPMIPIFFELSSLGDIWLILKEAFFRLFGFILFRKKKRGWGKVYDKDTGSPIPLATVNIYDEKGTRRESKITNNLGIYFFFVSPGKYALEAIKSGYHALISQDDAEEKTSLEDDYQGGILDVADPDLVNIDIPMTLEKSNLLRDLLNKKSLQSLLWFIFWAGFFVNVVIVILFPTPVNFLITFAYLLLAIIRNFSLGKRKWGMVLDQTGKPMQFAEVRVKDSSDSHLISRAVTDQYGRYLIVSREGSYVLEAQGRDGSGHYQTEVSLSKPGMIDEKIILTV